MSRSCRECVVATWKPCGPSCCTRYSSTHAPSPTTTSVTALVQYTPSDALAYVSTTEARAPRSTTMRLRGWETTGPSDAARPVERKTTSSGRSSVTPARGVPVRPPARGSQRGGEPPRPDATLPLSPRGEGRCVAPVDEDDARPYADAEALDVCGSGERRVGSMRKNESLVRDRRDAREAPLLLLHGGETGLGEPGDRALAELPQPPGGPRRAVARERFEGGDVALSP